MFYHVNMSIANRKSDKKPYHHGDLRETLLLAGEAALAELPIMEVSLREIARRAGVSHAAPKHHFSTLAEMFGEIAARGFQSFVDSLAEHADKSSDQTPEGRLLAMSRAYLRFAQANSAVYGLMFGSKAECAMTPALASASFAAWEQLELSVAKIVGANKVGNAALLVWSTVHGLSMLRIERRIPPYVEPEAALESSLRMLIAGLVAGKSL